MTNNLRNDLFEINGILKNYTPHSINLVSEDRVISIPSVGIARVKTESKDVNPAHKVLLRKGQVEKLKGINFKVSSFGEVEGLPEFDEYQCCIYIVSAVVKSACSDRSDLVVPSDLIRDEGGNIIGCRAFSF